MIVDDEWREWRLSDGGRYAKEEVTHALYELSVVLVHYQQFPTRTIYDALSAYAKIAQDMHVDLSAYIPQEILAELILDGKL